MIDVAADLEDAAADEENRAEQGAAESTGHTANNAWTAKCDRQNKYAVVRLFSTCIYMPRAWDEILIDNKQSLPLID